MLKAGTQTGSLINHLMSYPSNVEPELGMGATLLSWTDRTPATVIGWNPADGRLMVQEDKYTRVDKNGMSESQTYEYARDTTATIHYFKLTGKGWRKTRFNEETNRWKLVDGAGICIGVRERYYDYSF